MCEFLKELPKLSDCYILQTKIKKRTVSRSILQSRKIADGANEKNMGHQVN